MKIPTNPDPIEYRPNVGILLLDAEGRIFLGNRKGMTDAWQAPQGGIDPGEKPLVAAWREMEEEIGVSDRDAMLIRPARSWHRYDFPPEARGKKIAKGFLGQTQLWFAFRHSGHLDSIRIDTDHPEFDAWRFAPKSEVLSGIVSFKRAVYENVLADFADLLA